jgi:hypothetical protein
VLLCWGASDGVEQELFWAACSSFCVIDTNKWSQSVTCKVGKDSLRTDFDFQGSIDEGGGPSVKKSAFLFVSQQNLTSLNDFVSELESISVFVCSCEPPVARVSHLSKQASHFSSSSNSTFEKCKIVIFVRGSI